MKKTHLLLISLAVASCSFGQTNSLPQKMTIEIDGYAAKVNNRVITRGEVRMAMMSQLEQLAQTFQGAQLDLEQQKLFIKTRDELIERALIMEAFKEKGGEIPDQYIDDEIKRVIADRFKGDKAMFEQVLTEQKKTRQEYKDTLREQMAVGMMFNEEISRRARVTPEQIKNAYENNKEQYYIPEKVEYSVLVLNKGETPEDQAVKREEILSVQKQLKDGADFGTLATEVSEGSRAADGGKFPWMQPKDARPELQETLQSLPAGELSGIIETDSEFYILKIHARRQSGWESFNEVQQTIKISLESKERDRLKKRWISRLKSTIYNVTYDD